MAFKQEDMNDYSPSPNKAVKYSTSYDSSISYLSQAPSPDKTRHTSPPRLYPRRSPPALVKEERFRPQIEKPDYMANDVSHSRLEGHPVIRDSVQIHPRVLYMTKGEPTRHIKVPSYVICKKESMPVVSRERREPEHNLVASKIAALSRKQPTPLKARPSPQVSAEKEHLKVIYSNDSVHDSERESEESSCGIPEDVVTIETLPLQSLAADDMENNEQPLVLHRESFDPNKVEIGQNVYVVQVDRTDAIRVTSSI